MTIILRLQQLPWSATSMDIRRHFTGLSIPDGGVHIVGGENGDVFIAFSSDEDARRAMQMEGKLLSGNKITLMLSSKSEMQEVIARNRAVSQTKSDPFQEDSPSQSPVPSSQPLNTPGGDSLEQNRDYASFKDPSKGQPQSDQFDPKGQNQNLPNEESRVLGFPQRPGGNKSLLGTPPYSSQHSDPSLHRQPSGYNNPNSYFSGRRDEMYPGEMRGGDLENRPFLDTRHHPGVSSGHGPHDIRPFGAEKEKPFENQPRGNSFKNSGGPVDMDSRTPSNRRPPLLEHEPGGPGGRRPFGPYSDVQGREGLLDDHQSKRFKRGPEHSSAAHFEQGRMHQGEGTFGQPNSRGRFDEGSRWDRSFEKPKPGFQDDFKGSEFPSNNGPGAAKGFSDDLSQRGPMPGNRFGPEGQWDQKGSGMSARYPGDPFGLNEHFDDLRGTSGLRDRINERGDTDMGRMGPIEQSGPEDYRRRGDEPFTGRDRNQKQHPDDRMGPRERGPDRIDQGEHRGPGDRVGSNENINLAETRGPRDGIGIDDHRGRGDHMGSDGHRGVGEHRLPGVRMGQKERHSGERRGHIGPEEREERVLGQQRGQDSHMGPGDHMKRSKGDHMGQDNRFGPVDRMSPGNQIGTGGREDRAGSEDRIGLRERLDFHDVMGPRGPGVRTGPGGGMGLGDLRDVRDRMGPGDQMGPDDRIGPGDQFGPGHRVSPEDRVGLGDRMGVRDHFGPVDRFDPAERFGPGDRFGQGDRFDLGDRFDPGDRFGRDERMGPDGQIGIGSRFSPAAPFGNQDDMDQSDHKSYKDPFDHKGLRDHTGPVDPIDPRGKMGQMGNQWGPRDRARPSLLGERGLLEDEDRLGPRVVKDFGSADSMGPGNRIVPGGITKREPLIPERPQEERRGPNDRMVPADYIGSREGMAAGSSFRHQSRFGPAGPGIHTPEEPPERDSDMRRGQPAPHREAPKIPSLLDKRSELRKKSTVAGFIRITGMPFSVTAADIFDFFGGLTIADKGIRLNLDNNRNKPNGNGYIKFVSEEMATKACKLNMKYMGKRYIEVKLCRESDWDGSENQTIQPSEYPSKAGKISQRSRSRSPIRSTCVELKGLPHHSDINNIKDFFYGLAMADDKIFIARGSDNSASGVAYVEFPDQATFERALRKDEHYIGRHKIEVKTIFKEIMNARIAESKKHIQDKQASSRSSSSSRDPSNTREINTKGAGSRSASSRDAKISGPRDRNSRESSSRSSRDQDPRQSSRQSRESQKASDRDSRSRESDSRQSASRNKDPTKDTGPRSSDSRSRFSGDSGLQKRDGESKDQDNRRSGSGSKSSPKDSESKRPEISLKDERARSQQDKQPQPIETKQPQKHQHSTDSVKEIPDLAPKKPAPKKPAQTPRLLDEPMPPNLERSCLSMRNMPYNTSDEEIHNFFQDMELQPLMVHFLITPDGRPNGQAYVEMANPADALKAGSKPARIQDRNIIMSIITKGHMENCLAQGKPPHQPTQGLLGTPRGPPFPHLSGNHLPGPPMDFRPPLLGNKSPPFGMRNNPGPMRGPRPPPIDVLIARRCVVETSNLPFDIPIPAIIDFFGNHNVIPESVRLKTNELGRFSGEAMVAFRSAEDAGRAIADLNKSILGGRVIRLHLMKPL